MSLTRIKLHSTELDKRDAELIDEILMDVLKERGIDLYIPDNAHDSIAWEIEVLMHTKTIEKCGEVGCSECDYQEGEAWYELRDER